VLLLLKMHTHKTRGNKGQCVIFLFLIDKQPHVLMHNSFCSVALSKLFCGHKKSYSLDVRAFLYVRAGVGRNLRHAVCLPMAMMMMSRRARQILSGRSNCSHGLMDYLVPGVYILSGRHCRNFIICTVRIEREDEWRVLGCCGTSLNCLGKQTSPDRAGETH